MMNVDSIYTEVVSKTDSYVVTRRMWIFLTCTSICLEKLKKGAMSLTKYR